MTQLRVVLVKPSKYAIDGSVKRFNNEPGVTTLLALVGVQSHQFHRAPDLAAYARHHGVRHCVIGGPHPMSGGVDRLQVDSAADYAALRRATCDIDLAPLPDSLSLSDKEEALNRRIKLPRATPRAAAHAPS